LYWPTLLIVIAIAYRTIESPGLTAQPLSLQNVGGQSKPAELAVLTDKREINLLSPTTVQLPEDALYGNTQIEPIVMTREMSHSTDTSLTETTLIDKTNLNNDAPISKIEKFF